MPVYIYWISTETNNYSSNVLQKNVIEEHNMRKEFCINWNVLRMIKGLSLRVRIEKKMHEKRSKLEI